MKDLNILINANKLILYPTTILYLSVVGVTFAMVLQILLGITQVIIAIIITAKCYSLLNSKLKKLLAFYWLIAIIDLIAVFCSENIFDYFGMTVSFIIPMVIAICFHFLVLKINKLLTES